MNKQAMVLSAALSIASLTGSVASCASQPERRIPPEEPARFCYNTLGEITCYTAPQPMMGSVVALPPDPPKRPGSEDAPVTKVEPMPGEVVPPTTPVPAPIEPGKPIPLKPAATAGHDA